MIVITIIILFCDDTVCSYHDAIVRGHVNTVC